LFLNIVYPDNIRGDGNMLTEYIEKALEHAHYELIDDEEPYYGEIKLLQGVYATGKTLEECRKNLKEVVEGWLIISLKKGLPIPKIETLEISDSPVSNEHKSEISVDLLSRILKQAGINREMWLKK
jgi:predicted RNase H-like HicB family nuclease